MPVEMRRIRRRTQGTLTSSLLVLLLLVAFTAISVALPDPLPDPFHTDPPDQAVTTFVVQSNSAAGTTINLAAGRYKFVVSGVYTYSGPPGGLYKADAECSIQYSNTGASWVRNQYATLSPGQDPLDLLVDNASVEWSPTTNAASSTPAGSTVSKLSNPSCDDRDHTYALTIDWQGGRGLNFRIAEGNLADNSGTLTVQVLKPGARSKEELVAVLVVPSASQEGIFTPPLIVGQTYRLEVTGSYDYAPGRFLTADAECSIKPANTTWLSKYDPNVPEGQDILDLHVTDNVYNGWADGNVSWKPLFGGLAPGTCAQDASKTYEYVYPAKDPLGVAPREVTRLNLRVYDSGYLDNRGSFTVKLFHVVDVTQIPVPNLSEDQQPSLEGLPVPTPPMPALAPSSGSTSPECARDANGACIVVSVPSNSPLGAQTLSAVAPGEYLVQVSGIYNYETGVRADAECSRGTLAMVVNNDETWQRNRYPTTGGRDALDLMVAGKEVDWRPVGSQNPLGCRDGEPPADEHVYEVDLTWAGNGSGGPAPINFTVFDPGDYSRNSGNLTVKLFRPSSPLGEQPLATLIVNSTDPAGTLTPTLLRGQKYRFQITGGFIWYRYEGNGFIADAECSEKNTDFRFADATMNNNFPDPNRFDGRAFQAGVDVSGEDQLDVYVEDVAEGQLDYIEDVQEVDYQKVNHGPVKWVPKFPGTGVSAGSGIPTECAADSAHTYQYSFTAGVTGPVKLTVLEKQVDWYADNVGVFSVSIFLEG